MRFGHCSCMAGLGEVCSHVGAILFSLLTCVNKAKGTACTEELAQWNAPSKAALKSAVYAEGSKIAFTKAQRKRAAEGWGDPPPAKFPRPTPDECRRLYQMLHESEATEKVPVKSALLSVVPGYAERFIPRTIQLDIPTPLSQLYKPHYRSLPSSELQAKIDELFTELTITEEQV